MQLLTTKDISLITDDEVDNINKQLLEPEDTVEGKISAGGLEGRIYINLNNSILGRNNNYAKYMGGLKVRDFKSKTSDNFEEYARKEADVSSRPMTRKYGILAYIGALLYEELKISKEEYRSFYMGGGKSVILVPDEKEFLASTEEQKEKFFNEAGRIIEEKSPNYMAGKDMNTRVQDMNYIYEGIVGKNVSYNPIKGKYISCHEIKDEDGNVIAGTGEPSKITAWNQHYSMIGLAKPIFGLESLDGLTIGILGVGDVGEPLARMTRQAYPNAKLILSDVKAEKEEIAEQLKAEFVMPEEFYTRGGMHVISLNGPPEVLDENTVRDIVKAHNRYKDDRFDKIILCGAANAPFKTEGGKVIRENAYLIHINGIYYAFDFGHNWGGILDTTADYPGREIDNKATSLRIVKHSTEIASHFYELTEKYWKDKNLLPHETGNYVSSQVISAFAKKNLITR